jgi:hypothetical protein
MRYDKQTARYFTHPQKENASRAEALAIIWHRRAIKRLQRQQAFAERILKTIAIFSILSTAIFGIGSLGCWGVQLWETRTQPLALKHDYDWQTRKHICLGWMLFAFSSFLASASPRKRE